MDRLPDELINDILRYLTVNDIVRLQQVSTRLLKLGRDSTLWKVLCYDHSPAEAGRRRRQLGNGHADRVNGHLSLAQAIDAYQLDSQEARSLTRQTEELKKSRALANWEPGYPDESVDYYEEYIQRHAKIALSWKHLPGATSTDDVRIATGAALLRPDEQSTHAVCPLDDGSIIIYDLAASTANTIVGHSGPGLLTPGAKSADEIRSIMTNTTAVDLVATNDHRGFFAVGDKLHEVDLNSLSLVSSKSYSLSVITALSTCSPGQPLIVGTNESVHLHDAREPSWSKSDTSSTRAELIAGPGPGMASRISLTQPGPTSILHDPLQNDSIWVAGRFTSLLQYSLRCFPRLQSTLHSGARISSMAVLPFPYIPRQLNLVDNPAISTSELSSAKSAPGWTAICAGVYKGKGSLELYSMSSSTSRYNGEKYLNRQTASSSKLLGVASHGSKIVCSDGNGNIRWMERDGYSLVRSFNINEQDPSQAVVSTQGLWENKDGAHGQGDIVQKMLPFKGRLSSGRRSEKLLMWTADGRLGTLGFGNVDALRADEFQDAVEVQAESASQRALHDAERQYGMRMRRALERNADEVRFLRALGMG